MRPPQIAETSGDKIEIQNPGQVGLKIDDLDGFP